MIEEFVTPMPTHTPNTLDEALLDPRLDQNDFLLKAMLHQLSENDEQMLNALDDLNFARKDGEPLGVIQSLERRVKYATELCLASEARIFERAKTLISEYDPLNGEPMPFMVI